MGFFEFDHSQPEQEEGWAADFSSFGSLTNPVVLRERKLKFLEDPVFDDTLKMFQATLEPDHFQEVANRRFREHNDPYFERGVPTNNKTSSRNYNPNHTKIIDGEHKTLMTVGQIAEAMEGDDDDLHMYEHRIFLAEPKLSETQRSAMLKHMATHSRNKN